VTDQVTRQHRTILRLPKGSKVAKNAFVNSVYSKSDYTFPLLLQYRVDMYNVVT